MATNRGRPRGPSEPAPVVEVIPAACPKCGSSEREAFTNTKRHDMRGLTRDGRTFAAVVFRRTRCTDCGQVWVEKSFELEPTQKTAA